MLTIFAAFRCVFRPQQGCQGWFFSILWKFITYQAFHNHLTSQGLNTGVLLLDLERMRNSSEYNFFTTQVLPGWFSFCATHILVGFGQIDCCYTGGSEGAGGKVETWRNSWRSGLVNTITEFLHCLVYNCLHIWLTLYNCLHIWSTFYNWTYIWQDWLTLLSFEKPELINILPCEFNR